MSTKGHTVLQGLSYKLGPRTLQVAVSPRPTRFAERRAVLHSLQKFAQVEVFKKQDDQNSSFITVVAEKSQAKELVKMSPLHYQLATPRSTGSVKTFLTSATPTDPIINTKRTEDLDEADETTTEEVHKDFTVHIFPAESYIHSAAIGKSPLHGPWPVDRPRTAMKTTMKDALPDNIAAEGLSDWETGGQIPASARSQLWEDILLGTKSVDVRTRAVIDRAENRERREKLPPIMQGLLHLRQFQGRE